jgi:DNA processing protein
MSAHQHETTLPCAVCLRRSWLIARLAGHIEIAWSKTRGWARLLTLDDGPLVEAVAGTDLDQVDAEYERFDADAARARCRDADVHAICRCDERYPADLADLPDPPAVLYVYGEPARLADALARDCVAIVGSRRASPYGLEQGRTLGHGLADGGLTVVSGMALGVDSAAHVGALEADGLTVAVLACGPERAYPTSKRRLHARIAATGAVVSELPPGTGARRWCFPARNRIIAALGAVTVVVEARDRAGSMVTARLAGDLGRQVAAVPGLVTAPLAAGPNGLIAHGAAALVRGADDVVSLLSGGAAPLLEPDPAGGALDPDLRALLESVRAGRDTVEALAADGLAVDAALAGLAQLELRGYVRRGSHGRYAATR